MGHQKRGNGIFSPRVVKMAMGILGMCVIGYIVGPPLYWNFLEGLSFFTHSSSSACPPCLCDCSSSYPFLSLPQDCMKHDPDVSDEMEKHFADLVADELKQKEGEALETHRRSDMALLEAKKVASQYQKEADKCNSGMETCEEARERAEEALDAQRKITMMWEQRARQKGWKETVARRAREKK
ncbi:Autophagy protein 5 [Bienertia sinuspersici]